MSIASTNHQIINNKNSSNAIKGGGGGGRGGGGGSFGPKDSKIGLPNRVAQWYYKHGLFLSSYPTCAASIAIFVILFSCYPLLNIPLPGTIPTKIILPYNSASSFYVQNKQQQQQQQDLLQSNQTTNDEQQQQQQHQSTSNSNSHKFYHHNPFSTLNNLTSMEPPFPWAHSDPYIYVQQIILRSSIVPWKDNLRLTDAFRGPIHEVFKLLEIIRNHEADDISKTNLVDICLHIENVKRTTNNKIFPEYNCLILSPANFWQQNPILFNRDTNLLNSIFQYHNLQKSKVSSAEMLFGMQLRDTGIKSYPIRNRPRVIQYAITLILIENNINYLESLKEKLYKLYPLHQHQRQQQQQQQHQQHQQQQEQSTSWISGGNPSSRKSITYIYYPGELNLYEFVPLCIAFIILFCYVYFSIRKIDIIRSRLILAISAVITVLSSLMMSLGLCFFFGLTISMHSKGIFPYLIILIGLENVLVITKSVISTDDTFDVKIRVAQGLSREGWPISKTLLTEITILTIGLATFVPVIQEFCIFAIVGLISDFFLQMLLFSTVLAMDIKRIDFNKISKNINSSYLINTTTTTTTTTNNNSNLSYNNNVYDYYNRKRSALIHSSMQYKQSLTGCTTNVMPPSTMIRSRSHPRLTTLETHQYNHNQYPNPNPNHHHHHHQQYHQQQSTDILASNQKANHLNKQLDKQKKIPKRLRVVNLWARTRFFQRAFMIWMIFWIITIIYNSGIVEQLFGMAITYTNPDELTSSSSSPSPSPSSPFSTTSVRNLKTIKTPSTSSSPPTDDDSIIVNNILNYNHQTNNTNNLNITEQLQKLKYTDYDTNLHLSNFHWSTILKQYNISMSGKYVTILPSIRLSHSVTPDIALKLRNPNEKQMPPFQWKALALALDPIDFIDMDNNDMPSPISSQSSQSSSSSSQSSLLTSQFIQYDVDGQQIHEQSTNVNHQSSSQQQSSSHNNNIYSITNFGTITTTTPLYPKSPMEIFLATILCCISVFVLTYMMVVFYRCICTRNYAEWRSSWTDSTTMIDINNGADGSGGGDGQRIVEGSPIQIKAHQHHIECLVTDGNQIIASSCLDGQIKLWDALNGELLSYIDRNKYFRQIKSNQNLNENEKLLQQQHQQNAQQQIIQQQVNYYYKIVQNVNNRKSTTLSLSPPSPPSPTSSSSSSLIHRMPIDFVDEQQIVQDNKFKSSPIWCLDYFDNLIIIGCANGRIEVWEGTTGTLKCVYENESKYQKHGITNIHLIGDKIIAARLNGRIDFLKLETYNQGKQIDWGFTSAYRRTHVRTGSTGSLSLNVHQSSINNNNNNNIGGGIIGQSSSSSSSSSSSAAAQSSPIINSKEEIRCILEYQHQGHQQPITCMDIVDGTVFTGSQDHTLKLFKLDTKQLQYTFHGHCGPITCLFIDPFQTGTGGSGSQDGLLCVWDFLSGACIYAIQAHDGAIVSLVCSPSYVISMGGDERLCIWERFQGNLLNTIAVTHIYTSLLMLTPSLLVTGKPGSLIVWNCRSGEPQREVKLDFANAHWCPKTILSVCGSVICDYGNELRLIRFPLVADKCE